MASVVEKRRSPTLQPDEEYAYEAPDGGWGWLVLGGTVLVSMLIPGTIKSFGVLFIEFIEVFNASAVTASWIPALCYFLYCSLGPLSSYLCVKTSYRTVTIIGGLFAAAGMILSYFATSILFLCFSYGFLVGTGAGLSFPPGVFIVTSYFVKLRGFANGLAVSGSAIGSIILPPFLQYLLEEFGYRGATLIMGGLTLNVIAGALVYDPVEKHMKRVIVKKTVENIDLNQCPQPEKEKLLGEKTLNGVHEVKPKETKINLAEIKVSQVRGDVLKPGEKRILEVSRQGDVRHVQTGVRKASSPARFAPPDQARRKLSEWPTHTRYPRLTLGSASPMSRKFSVLGSTMSNSSFRYVSTAWHGSTLVGLHPDLSSSPNVKTASSFTCCGLCGPKDPDSKDDPTSLRSLLKDPIFIILILAHATSAIGYTNFIILVPSYALELGFNKDQATYLLSIVACLDLVGRIGGAALSDILNWNKCVYFFGGLVVSGISLLCLPLVNSYLGVCSVCALFGLSSGVYIGITAVIMVDLLGEDLLASSYGISLFVNGLLQLVGPPLCGVIYDSIGNFGPIFLSFGCCLIAGGLSWIFVVFIQRKQLS